MTPQEIHELTQATSYSPNAAKMLAEGVNSWLSEAKAGSRFRTTEMLKLMGVLYDQMRPITRHLYTARQMRLLDGRWLHDPKRRFMGKPSIVWLGGPRS